MRELVEYAEDVTPRILYIYKDILYEATTGEDGGHDSGGMEKP